MHADRSVGPILARPISRPARVWQWRERNQLVAALMATVAASLFVGIALTSHFAIKADIRAAALEHSEKDLRDKRNSALGLRSALTPASPVGH